MHKNSKAIPILIVLFFGLMLNSNSIFAHPSKLNSFGCHICKTNCEKWGLKKDEYHCHKQLNESEKPLPQKKKPKNNQTKVKVIKPIAVPQLSKFVSTIDEEMIKQGYAFAYTKSNADMLKELINLEKKAKDEKTGLWGFCNA